MISFESGKCSCNICGLSRLATTVPFFGLPSGEPKRETWMRSLLFESTDILPDSVIICGRHFLPSMYDHLELFGCLNRYTLTENAYPCLFEKSDWNLMFELIPFWRSETDDLLKPTVNDEPARIFDKSPTPAPSMDHIYYHTVVEGCDVVKVKSEIEDFTTSNNHYPNMDIQSAFSVIVKEEVDSDDGKSGPLEVYPILPAVSLSRNGMRPIHSHGVSGVEMATSATLGRGRVRLGGGATVSRRNMRPRSKRAELIDFCRRVLIANHDPKQLVECKSCGVRLKLFSSTDATVNGSRAFNHVMTHLPEKILRCGFCSHRSKSMPTMSSHLKMFHDKPKPMVYHFVDECEQYQYLIRVRIRECFGYKYVETTKSTVKGDLVAYCRHLLLENYDRGNLVRCSVCDSTKKWLPIDEAPHASDAFEHVLGHVHELLFRCRICDRAEKTETSMKSHLRGSHQLEQTNSYILDKLADFREKITKMIDRCYGKLQKTFQYTKPTLDMDMDSLRFYCAQLIKNYSSDGALTCFVCRKRIVVFRYYNENKYSSRREHRIDNPINHALTHLGETRRECNDLCCCALLGPHVFLHIPSCQVGEILNEDSPEFEEYQRELVDMLEKCFDQKSECTERK